MLYYGDEKHENEATLQTCYQAKETERYMGSAPVRGCNYRNFLLKFQ